jgi:hypothetical protein
MARLNQRLISALDRKDAEPSDTSSTLSTSRINRLLATIARTSRGAEIPPSLLQSPPAPGAVSRIAPGALLSAPKAGLNVVRGRIDRAFQPAVIGGSLVGRLPAATILSEGLSFCSASTRLKARCDILQWCKAAASHRPQANGGTNDSRAVARSWQQMLESVGAPEDLRLSLLDDPSNPEALLFPSRRCISPAPLPPHCGLVPVVLPQQIPAIGAAKGDIVLVAPLSSASVAAAEELVQGANNPECVLWAASTVLVVTGCTGVPAARYGCDLVSEIPKRWFTRAGPHPVAVVPHAALGTVAITQADGTLGVLAPRGTPVFFGLRCLGFAETQRRGMMRDNGDGRRPGNSVASLLLGNLQQATLRRYVLRR